MQIMIDVNIETPEALEAAGQFLIQQAALRRLIIPTVETPAPPAPPAPAASDAPPTPHIPIVAPTLPTPIVASNDVPAPAAPAPEPAPVYASPPAADVFDRSGVPFDARIHQAIGNVKKDGTWKLKKNLDTKSPGLVESVMRELAPRIKKQPSAAPTPEAPAAPAAPAAPEALPAPASNDTPAPAAPAAEVAAPPAPAPAGPFRMLIRKISEAREAGRLTPDEVNQCVASGGAPSLQLLNNLPHLIPAVEAAIDSILLTR